MLTEKGKKQEALLHDYMSKEKEFLKLQEDYAILKNDLSKVDGDFKVEKKRKDDLKDEIQKWSVDYNHLMNEHKKLLDTLSLCAETIKDSLKVFEVA